MSRDNQRSTIRGTSVTVKDGQVEKALRKFKNKIQDLGKLEELREREHYTKPTTKRRMAKNKAVRRHQKQTEADILSGRMAPPGGTRRRLY